MLCAGRGLNCGKSRLRCTMTMHQLKHRFSSAFIWQNMTSIVPYPPYSLDLASADFFLFPKLKTTLKGQHFQTIEEIQENVITELHAITESAFQEAFQQWKKCWEWYRQWRVLLWRKRCLKCCKMSNNIIIANISSFFEHALYSLLHS